MSTALYAASSVRINAKAEQYDGSQESIERIFEILPPRAQNILGRFQIFPLVVGQWMVVIDDLWLAMDNEKFQSEIASKQDFPVNF